MKTVRFSCVGLLFAVTLAWNLPGRTQTTSATISGRVLDGTGATIPDVQIVLKDMVTGKVRSTTSNSEGEYLFTDVPAAKYRITAFAEGFMPRVIEIEAAVGADRKSTRLNSSH